MSPDPKVSPEATESGEQVSQKIEATGKDINRIEDQILTAIDGEPMQAGILALVLVVAKLMKPEAPPELLHKCVWASTVYMSNYLIENDPKKPTLIENDSNTIH